MPFSLGWAEITVLLVLSMFVFGPERLPGMAAEAAKGLRKVRLYVKGVTDDLKTELGPELGDVDLASLHPKAFVKKHLFSDEDLFEVADDEPEEDRAGAPLAVGELAPWDPDTT